MTDRMAKALRKTAGALEEYIRDFGNNEDDDSRMMANKAWDALVDARSALAAYQPAPTRDKVPRGYEAYDPISQSWLYSWTRENFDKQGWEVHPLYRATQPAPTRDKVIEECAGIADELGDQQIAAEIRALKASPQGEKK